MNTTHLDQFTRADAPAPPVRWNDPSLWRGVSIGNCKCCQQHHVLRNGFCWTCEHPRDDGQVHSSPLTAPVESEVGEMHCVFISDWPREGCYQCGKSREAHA